MLHSIHHEVVLCDEAHEDHVDQVKEIAVAKKAHQVTKQVQCNKTVNVEVDPSVEVVVLHVVLLDASVFEAPEVQALHVEQVLQVVRVVKSD